MTAKDLKAHAAYICEFIRQWNHLGRPDPSPEHRYRLANPNGPRHPAIWLQVKNGELMRRRELVGTLPRALTPWASMGNPDHVELVYRELAQMDLDEYPVDESYVHPEDAWVNRPKEEVRCCECQQAGPVTISGLCAGCKREASND